MKNNTFETLIGAFVVLVTIFFISFFLRITAINRNKSQTYSLYAEFENIEGINIGSDVKISGIKVGSVSAIKLNENFKAYLTISIYKDYLIPEDSIFKVSTSGLIGNKFINIKIGSSDEYLNNKDIVDFTESVMDLEDLISRFVFNSEKKNETN